VESSEENLRRPIEYVAFADIDLQDVVQFLREYSDVNIHVNWRALFLAGIQQDTKVSLVLRRVSIQRVLDLVLRDLNGLAAGPEAELAYVVDDGVVLISTRLDLANALSREVAIEPAAQTEVAAPRSPSLPEWVGRPQANLVVVFTDIVGSVALGQDLGDHTMKRLRVHHIDHAARLVRASGGYLFSTAGDGIVAVFPVVTCALDFALAFHGDPGDPRVQVRMGMHVGPVDIVPDPTTDWNICGTTVDYAARVLRKATGPEIWLTELAHAQVRQELAEQHRPLRWERHAELTLEGFPGLHVLWSIGFAQEGGPPVP